MNKQDIIVIGASAGGVNALMELVGNFPEDFDASVFIVLHLSPHSKSMLPSILKRASGLKAVNPADGEKIEKGKIYIAPPDHHLLVDKDVVLVKKGPKENRFRPSVDALFRSAAYTYGPRVIGIVLTGLLDDGTAGMWAIKHFGGTTIVQDPAEALYASMPESVLEYVDVDFCLPLKEIALQLVKLCNKPAPKKPKLPNKDVQLTGMEFRIAAQSNEFDMGVTNIGSPSLLTCPECNGVLMSIKEGKITRYRCHTGHAFSDHALLSDITKTVEEDLWKVVRGMEECVLLLEEMSRNAENMGNKSLAVDFQEKADDIRTQSQKIKSSIFVQERLGDHNTVNSSNKNRSNGKRKARANHKK